MTNNDLKEFENSLRQLEFIADVESPTRVKPGTRDANTRSRTLDPSFFPQVDVTGLTERGRNDEDADSNKFYKTHGASTRKPKNGSGDADMFQLDSLIGGGG